MKMFKKSIKQSFKYTNPKSYLKRLTTSWKIHVWLGFLYYLNKI